MERKPEIKWNLGFTAVLTMKHQIGKEAKNQMEPEIYSGVWGSYERPLLLSCRSQEQAKINEAIGPPPKAIPPKWMTAVCKNPVKHRPPPQSDVLLSCLLRIQVAAHISIGSSVLALFRLMRSPPPHMASQSQVYLLEVPVSLFTETPVGSRLCKWRNATLQPSTSLSR